MSGTFSKEPQAVEGCVECISAGLEMDPENGVGIVVGPRNGVTIEAIDNDGIARDAVEFNQTQHIVIDLLLPPVAVPVGAFALLCRWGKRPGRHGQQHN